MHFSTKTQVRFVPSLPAIPDRPGVPGQKANRELPEEQQLTLMISAGLTLLELQAMSERAVGIKWGAETEQELIDKANAAFGPIVTIGPGTFTLNGKALTSIGDYLVAVAPQPGAPLLKELTRAIQFHNSVEGLNELFFGRLSGGTTSTP